MRVVHMYVHVHDCMRMLPRLCVRTRTCTYSRETRALTDPQGAALRVHGLAHMHARALLHTVCAAARCVYARGASAGEARLGELGEVVPSKHGDLVARDRVERDSHRPPDASKKRRALMMYFMSGNE